jgi:hypothetical protein
MECGTSLNDSQQRAQQHGPFLKESPVLTCLRSVVAVVPATTVVAVVQAAACRTKQVLPSLEQSTFRLVPVAQRAPATQTMAKMDQLHPLAQFPLLVAMVAVQMSAQEAHPSLVRAQAETEAAVLLCLVNQAATVRRIRLLAHRQTMPVAVAVAVGSMTNLAVLAVLVVAALAVDSMAHQAPTVLQELMHLVVAAVAVPTLHPQRVPVDQELSLFVTRCQTFQHPTLMPLMTWEPTPTTSLQQPR